MRCSKKVKRTGVCMGAKAEVLAEGPGLYILVGDGEVEEMLGNAILI